MWTRWGEVIYLFKQNNNLEQRKCCNGTSKLEQTSNIYKANIRYILVFRLEPYSVRSGNIV